MRFLATSALFFCLSGKGDFIMYVYIDCQKLNNERVKAGKSVYQLADEACLSESTLDHAQKGIRRMNESSVHRLCNALEISPSEILITKLEVLDKYRKIIQKIEEDSARGLDFSVRILKKQAETLKKQIEAMK